MIDWQAAVLACRRANAAYIIPQDQAKSAFELLGDTFIGQYANASHQAVLSADVKGETHLSISGTRASSLKLMDVFADVSLEPVSIAGGTITQGVVEGMQQMWDWVLATVPAGDVVNVSGHSLGGSRAQASPAFIDSARLGIVHSFAAPKFIAADFFAAHADVLPRMVCVLNGQDGWASWPWFDPRWSARPPIDHVWLKNGAGTFQMIPGPKWPSGWVFADHDIDRYQARLQAIAGSGVPA
ncbi:hypothetical protein [Paraburkholderia nemoris]|uniref:hypothetical protein n=1 Tax=Paraburkholderia nemoris TaxID=2793076 RepID=UPI001B24DE35|nr:hypothetical protein [Paraburkholderia nemoris]CAE6837815.1 hypothetical protein R75777_06916 [Paraburkholderia nemoris]